MGLCKYVKSNIDIERKFSLAYHMFCVYFEFSQILEAFVKDDSLFVKSCRQLMAQNEKVVTMPQFEFRNICDNKMESIEKRISSYKQVWCVCVTT